MTKYENKNMESGGDDDEGKELDEGKEDSVLAPMDE